MKLFENLIEKLEDIEPTGVVFACLMTVLVVATAIIVVDGALIILCLVRGIASVAAGAL